MNKTQKPDLWRAGPCGKNMGNRGWFSMAFSHGPVNLSDLYFHLLPVAGLGLASGWADMLTLWCPFIDQAAQMLLDVARGRI